MYTQASVEPAMPFHAGGFDPAVSLTEDLPQGVDADILLLGCGDVRNIIYTSYVEQGLPERKLDITACDVDEFIIARNILLFTFLLDADEKVSLRQVWNIYYNLYVDDPEAEIIETQAAKLAKLSSSLQNWHASPYGATLRFCDEASLTLVHDIWTEYAEEAHCMMRTDRHHQTAFRYALNTARAKQHYDKQPTEQDVSPSCAPLAMEMASGLLSATHQHWERGLLSTQPVSTSSDGKPPAAEIPNPIFATPITTFSVLKSPTNPLLGFHLGAAQAQFVEHKDASSSKAQETMFESALLQFRNWTDAFVKAAHRTVIRFAVCEAFAFCYTLRVYRKTGTTTCGHYRGKIGFDPFKLAESEYGAAGKAPEQFDIIDTSTLSHTVSILNLLVSAGPLLKDGPSSTLYTTDLRTRIEFKFEKLLYEESTIITILLGLVPAEYWTNATAVSSADQLLAAWSDEAATREGKEPDFKFRISWKQIKHIAGQQSLPTLHVEILDLSNMVYTVYCRSFFGGSPPLSIRTDQDEEILSVKHIPISPHQPNTVGAFLSTIADICNANPERVWEKFLMTITARTITGRGAGDHAAAFFAEAPLPFVFLSDLGGGPGPVPAPFNNWMRIPKALAITVIVPYEHWMGLKALADARAGQSREPALEIFGHLSSNNVYGQQGRMTTVFSDIQISFGTLATEGSPDHMGFTVHVREDEGGWNGTSPMIISYRVPTNFVRSFFGYGLVGFTTTRLSTGKDRLDEIVETPNVETPKCDYERRISDGNYVFITRYRPRHACREVKEDSLRAIGNIMSPNNEAPSNIKFTASFAEVEDLITITGHVDITSAKGKRLLADRAPVQVQQATPFTLDVIIGNKTEGITIPLTFPAPVRRENSTTRIARKSAYIEVIASPAKHSTNPEILDTFFLPTTKHIPGQPPATLNIPHLNLDTLPIPSLTDKRRARFLNTLTSLMFSPRELLQRGQGQPAATNIANPKAASPPSARLNFKESLHAIFTLVSDQQPQAGKPPPATRLFILALPSTGAHILLFVSTLRLDAAHGSVVLDAAVVPLTKALIVGEREGQGEREGKDDDGVGSSSSSSSSNSNNGPLTPFLHTLPGTPSYTLTLTGGELALWKRTLPALAERCRTWMHRPGVCEYEGTATTTTTTTAAGGGGKVPVSLDEGEPVLCGCGCGELPEGFVDFPGWEMVRGYATRVAISPVFVSGMVEEVVEPAVARRMAEERRAGGGGDSSGGGAVRQCGGCGKLETVDGVVLKKCTRCLRVVYCSVGCQKKDWKRHKVECAATVAQGQK